MIKGLSPRTAVERCKVPRAWTCATGREERTGSIVEEAERLLPELPAWGIRKKEVTIP